MNDKSYPLRKNYRKATLLKGTLMMRFLSLFFLFWTLASSVELSWLDSSDSWLDPAESDSSNESLSSLDSIMLSSESIDEF